MPRYTRKVIDLYSQKLFKSFNLPAKQPFNYFLVIDFEATCDKNIRLSNQEIIEFPCLKVDASSLTTLSIFHQYVRPVYNPHLTPFCTQLTGITQECVNSASEFAVVMNLFADWIAEEGLLANQKSFVFVTCGDWDLNTLFPLQCQLSSVKLPPYMRSWCNIKSAFIEAYGYWPRSLRTMLADLRIEHIGRYHSGIDDCRNIAAVLRYICSTTDTIIRQTGTTDKALN